MVMLFVEGRVGGVSLADQVIEARLRWVRTVLYCWKKLGKRTFGGENLRSGEGKWQGHEQSYGSWGIIGGDGGGCYEKNKNK